MFAHRIFVSNKVAHPNSEEGPHHLSLRTPRKGSPREGWPWLPSGVIFFPRSRLAH
ncbi:unnamed protein product [marine sediment metagenome]|uniref:Uncharacterized protein n=1 Tax=marine sediment metagenome TaxID=412755 RepID=X0Y885_9ZZZZ